MFFQKRPQEPKIFVATINAYSKTKDGEISESMAANLYKTEISEVRSFESFGCWPSSLMARKVRAAIEGWVHGGPMPVSMELDNSTPPPKPRKDIPAKKPKEKQAATTQNNVINLADKKRA